MKFVAAGTAVILCILLLPSCKMDSHTNEVAGADMQLVEPDSINSNYIDSDEVHRFFTEFSLLKNQEERVLKFYAKRNFQYAWFDNRGLNEPARNFINMIRNYGEEGVSDTLVYDTLVTEWYTHYAGSSASLDSLSSNMEVMLTAQFFQYAERIWGGLPEEKTKDLDWYIKRKRLPYIALLDSMLQRPEFFTSRTPVFRQYDSLKKWLQYYRSIESTAPWPTIIPDKKKYEPGDSSPVIAEIRKRLFWLKDISPNDTSSNHYDASLESAVKIFQSTHGLAADGHIGQQTIDLLNKPLQKRIEQIVVNMERCRWVPAQPAGDYIVVNIPEFVLRVYSADTLSWQCNVVVGKTSTQTVIFNGDLKYVVFAPYWNVPSSIIANEILPACKRNPGYINSHNMEVVGAGGKVISPSSINWSSYSGGNFPYLIRQKPGERNSLGLVKFLFPNEYSIYFHDTPSKSLFAEEKRSFSHGCIRVSEPLRLAEFLLRNDSTWTPEKIKAAMNGGKETYVTLNKTVPVFIGYLTCFVTPDGRLNFRDDIYGHDKRLAAMMFSDSAL